MIADGSVLLRQDRIAPPNGRVCTGLSFFRPYRFRGDPFPSQKSTCLYFYLSVSVLNSVSISLFEGKWITRDMIREAAVGRNDVGVLKKK